MQESLKIKTIKGVGWSGLDNVITMGVTFIVGLILARLLSPEEYGLIGIITIFITISSTFVVSGFSNALIRKKDATNDDYDTVFLFNIGASGVMYFLLFFGAPYIADFFSRPQLILLTRVMGLILFINAFSLVQTAILTKQINFKTQTKISFIASFSSGTIGVVMAYNGCGVWSLVGQQLSRGGINSILLWYLNGWRPRLRFYRENFYDLFEFGWKLLVSNLLNNIWDQMNSVVIGKYYQPATLGQYTRASGFASLFSSNLTQIIERVSYPTLSTIQDDKERLKNGYRRIIKITMLITFVTMMGLAAVAKPLILVLIGVKWDACVPMLQILCFSMALYPLHSLNLNMLKVQGRSDLFLKLEIIKKFIALSNLAMGVFVGIYAMLICGVVTGCIAYYLNAYYSGPFLNYSIWRQILDILPSFVTSLIVAIPVYLISFLQITPYALLPMQLVIGAAILIAVCEYSKRPEYVEVREIAVKAIKKLKR